MAQARSVGLQDFLGFQPLTLLQRILCLLIGICGTVFRCKSSSTRPDQPNWGLRLPLISPVPKPGLVERLKTAGIESPGVLEVIGTCLF